MTKRDELINLSGQIINGMMSADSSIVSKLIDRTITHSAADTAVELAIKMLDKIDQELYIHS